MFYLPLIKSTSLVTSLLGVVVFSGWLSCSKSEITCVLLFTLPVLNCSSITISNASNCLFRVLVVDKLCMYCGSANTVLVSPDPLNGVVLYCNMTVGLYSISLPDCLNTSSVVLAMYLPLYIGINVTPDTCTSVPALRFMFCPS